MAKEATAKCKEKSRVDLEEAINSLPVSIDYNKNLLHNNSLHTSLSSELEKQLRNLSAKDSYQVRENAEFHARLYDLEITNKEQKLASIRWFGEQGKQEHIAVLEELENDEEDAEIKSAIKKAMLRLNERINPGKSKKIKMRVRMNGRVKPLPVDEDDILLDDNEVYVSHVKSSVKVKMKVRMNGRVKPLPVDEEDMIDLYG